LSIFKYLKPKITYRVIIARMRPKEERSEYDRLSNGYMEIAAVAYFNPSDYDSLIGKEGGNVKVKGRGGEVVLKPLKDERVPKNTIIIPPGPWANALIDDSGHGGIPHFKSLNVEVMVVKEPVTKVEEILKR